MTDSPMPPARMPQFRKLILCYICGSAAATDGPPWPTITPWDMHARSTMRKTSENCCRGHLRALVTAGVLENPSPDMYRLPPHADPRAIKQALLYPATQKKAKGTAAL